MWKITEKKRQKGVPTLGSTPIINVDSDERNTSALQVAITFIRLQNLYEQRICLGADGTEEENVQRAAWDNEDH
jgi:hypothetical protein